MLKTLVFPFHCWIRWQDSVVRASLPMSILVIVFLRESLRKSTVIMRLMRPLIIWLRKHTCLLVRLLSLDDPWGQVLRWICAHACLKSKMLPGVFCSRHWSLEFDASWDPLRRTLCIPSTSFAPTKKWKKSLALCLSCMEKKIQWFHATMVRLSTKFWSNDRATMMLPTSPCGFRLLGTTTCHILNVSTPAESLSCHCDDFRGLQSQNDLEILEFM